MRALVTGAGGQLGRELVEAFAAHEVLGLGRDQLDVTDAKQVESIVRGFRPNLVLHAAAWTAVDDCESDPARAYAVNASGTANVTEAARHVGARVIYFSTDYVFDGSLDRPYTESDEPNPKSVYGASKLQGERVLDESAAIVRTSWVFGRYGNNIVKTILRLAERPGELRFVDDQFGIPTCAADIAAATVNIAERELRGVIHATNTSAVSWYEFAREVLEIAGEDPGRVKPVSTDSLDPPRPAPRPRNSVLANTVLESLGINMRHHREALEEVVGQLRR